MSEDRVKAKSKNTKRIQPRLTAARELALYKEYQTGSPEAFRLLVEDNLRNARYHAEKIPKQSKSYDEVEDYFQVGACAILEALPKYKPEKGYRLTTYLDTCIRRKIIKYSKRDEFVVHEMQQVAIWESGFYDESYKAEMALDARESLHTHMLSEEERRAVELRLLGFSYAEIAEKMRSNTRKYWSGVISQARKKIASYRKMLEYLSKCHE